MITTNQKRAFKNEMVDDSLLEAAIEWIKSNLSPDDVFDKSQLDEWAASNGYVGETECDE